MTSSNENKNYLGEDGFGTSIAISDNVAMVRAIDFRNEYAYMGYNNVYFYKKN